MDGGTVFAAAVIGLSVGVMAGILFGLGVADRSWRQAAISKGFAHYDPLTAEFKWSAP